MVPVGEIARRQGIYTSFKLEGRIKVRDTNVQGIRILKGAGAKLRFLR